MQALNFPGVQHQPSGNFGPQYSTQPPSGAPLGREEHKGVMPPPSKKAQNMQDDDDEDDSSGIFSEFIKFI